MSRSTSVKKKSLLKTSDNSLCNKENVNIPSTSLEELDSPRIGELQQASEKLIIDEERPLRKRRTSIKSNSAGTKMGKSVNEKKSRASSKADNNSKKEENAINQGKKASISTKIKYEKPSCKEKKQKRGDEQSTSAESFSGIKDGGNPSRKRSVNKVKPNDEFPTKIGTLSELLLTTNNKTLPAPIKPRPRTNTGHENSPIPTVSKVNKDDRKAIKTGIKSTRKQIIQKTPKLEFTNGKTASWKINKTELSSPSGNNNNVKISQSTIPIKPRGNKESAAKPKKIMIPKVESPAVALVKHEKLSPQSPIASVSVKFESWGTPPTTSTGILSAIDMNKYDKSAIDERKVSNNKSTSKQEDVDKVLGPTSLNQDVMKKKLKNDDGFSSVDPKLRQHSSKGEPEEKPQVNPVGKSQQEGSRKKSHQRQRKEKKVAAAFEKLAKRFVSTAKRMGYLDESKENSSTDDSGDSKYSGDCSSSSQSSESSDDSEHSTDCSCSSCTDTSSDDLTEYTVSTSSSTGDSDSSTDTSSDTD